jgi:hypothetical protein
MHAGQYHSLEEVIEHYSEMVDKFVLNHHDYALMEPLHLSNPEKLQIVEFLKSLTDLDLTEGRYPEIPFLVVSGYSAESEGIDEIFKSAPWLEKPVTAAALESALRSLIAP